MSDEEKLAESKKDLSTLLENKNKIEELWSKEPM